MARAHQNAPSGRKKNSRRARKEAKARDLAARARLDSAAQEQKLDDNRRHPRYEVRHPLRAKCQTWSQFLHLYACNISKGGLFLAVDELPAVDTRLELQFDLPNGAQLTLLGRVAHIVTPAGAKFTGGQPGFGVELDALTEEEEAALDSITELARRHEQVPPPPLKKK